MDNKKTFIIIVIAVALFFVIRSMMKKAGNQINDFISDTPLGWMGGVRSTAGKAAFKKIKSLPWLKHDFIVLANEKYNKSSYIMEPFPDNGTNYLTANNIAYDILGQSTLLGGLIFENSEKALDAIDEIQNQVQAAQVGFSLWNINGKDFSETINWLSDEAMIKAADKLSKLRTGIRFTANNKELTKITV